MADSLKDSERAHHSQVDAQLDTLYAAPLNDFVAVRKSLASELKKTGDAGGAQRVAALSKPNVAAWVTNQTVRRAPELVQRLLTVTQALARTQRAARPRAAGKGAEQPDDFQSALAEQRQVISRLREVAAAVLAEQGRGDGGAVMDKVEKNLRWGPLSEDDRAAFERGRLTGDLSPPGFGALLAGAAGEARLDSTASTAVKQSPLRSRAGDHGAGHVGPAPAPTKAVTKTKEQAARLRAQAVEEQHALKARLATLRARLRQASTDCADARRSATRSDQLRAAAAGRVRAVEDQLAAAQSALTVAETAHQAALAKLASCETTERTLRDELGII